MWRAEDEGSDDDGDVFAEATTRDPPRPRPPAPPPRARPIAEATASASATPDPDSSEYRRVSIGWLREQSDQLRISLAGLVSALSFNRDKPKSAGDEAWFDQQLENVIVNFLGLSKDVKAGIAPLALIGSDPQPLAQVWMREPAAVRERAFGELYAQCILEIGVESVPSAQRRYDARTHGMLMSLASAFGLSADVVGEFEVLVAELVSHAAKFEKTEPTAEEKKDQARSRSFRNFKIGAAAVAGAVAVGVTGGLALPMIGASLATFGGAAATTGAFMGGVAGTALFTTLFSAGGLSLTGYKMSRRLGSSLKQFEFKEVPRLLNLPSNLPSVASAKADVGADASAKADTNAKADADTEAGKIEEAREKKKEADQGLEDDGNKEREKEGVKAKEEVEEEVVEGEEVGEEAEEEEDVVEAEEEEEEEEEEEVGSFRNGLHVSILVSGWASKKSSKKADNKKGDNDARASARASSGSVRVAARDLEWSAVATRFHTALGQPFELVWETEVLREVSTSLSNFAVNQAVSKAVTETLAHTTLAALTAAVAWPMMLVSAASYIDNSFSVACNRAKLAGEELARAILGGAHGRRPVTLVGYSLGALVIFHCLQFLDAKGKVRGKQAQAQAQGGTVLDVVLLGAPVAASKEQWAVARSVVAGRLVNAYCPNDWILALLYRTSKLSVSKIAGLYPVNQPGIDDVNLSAVVSTQVDYHDKLDEAVALVFDANPLLSM